MPAIPREPGFDSSRALLADPYRFIAARCRRHGTDLFETRFLLRRTICMTGPPAARLFYDPERFQRQGAAPEALRATLFGKGAVQGLDGAMHRQRKAMFMALVEPGQVQALADRSAEELLRSARNWAGGDRLPLYDALHEPLARAVCTWAGVPLAAAELPLRTRQLTALFDQAAAVGRGHLQARLARWRAERWLAGLVRDIRAGRVEVPEDSAALAVARHRDADGRELRPRIAAVELLNLLRPTVAVSVYIVFAAHAMHLHPACRERLAGGDLAYVRAFIEEVRRWYPFFPAVAARVRRDFAWQGYRFPRGRRVVLDLHGTNRDPRSWDAPDEFRPERFLERSPTPFNFVPQGGGDAAEGHRCPGEDIALALTWVAIDFLLKRLHYEVPKQDLGIDYARLPALPRDRLVLAGIRLAE